jgi:hypothetical protein
MVNVLSRACLPLKIKTAPTTLLACLSCSHDQSPVQKDAHS